MTHQSPVMKSQIVHSCLTESSFPSFPGQVMNVWYFVAVSYDTRKKMTSFKKRLEKISTLDMILGDESTGSSCRG